MESKEPKDSKRNKKPRDTKRKVINKRDILENKNLIVPRDKTRNKKPKDTKVPKDTNKLSKVSTKVFTTGITMNEILKCCGMDSLCNLLRSNKGLNALTFKLYKNGMFDPIPNNIDIVELLSNSFFQTLKDEKEEYKDKECLKLIKKLAVCDIEDIYYIFVFARGISFKEARKYFIENIEPKEKLECLKHLGSVDCTIFYQIFGGKDNLESFISRLKPGEIPKFFKGIKFESLDDFKVLFRDWKRDFVEKTTPQERLEILKCFDQVYDETIYAIFGGKEGLQSVVSGLSLDQKLELAKIIKFDDLSSFKLIFTDFQKEFVEQTNNQQKLECIKCFDCVNGYTFYNMFGGKKGLRNFISKLKLREILELAKNVRWGHVDYFMNIFTDFQKEFVEQTDNQQKLECINNLAKCRYINSVYFAFFRIFGGSEEIRNFVFNLEPKEVLKLAKSIKFDSFYSLKEVFQEYTIFILHKLTPQQKLELINCFDYIGYDSFCQIFGGEEEVKKSVVPKLTIYQKLRYSTKLGGTIKTVEMFFESVEKFYKETNENQRYLVLKSLRYDDREKIRQKISEIEGAKEEKKMFEDIANLFSNSNTENNTNKNKNELTISTKSK